MFTTDPLRIYLQDHLAGATFGLALARRAQGENGGTEFGDFLARLADEIEEDRQELIAIIDGVDAGKDRLKIALAWAGEKADRLDGQRLERLIVRAESQLAGLREHHGVAAHETFSHP